MRILDVTSITDSSEMPLKSGTLQFLQDAYTELFSGIAIAICAQSGYNPQTVYVLWGCNNSTVAPIFNISAGFVFLGGKFYYVPATNFTTAAGLIAAFNFQTTQYVGNGLNADPVTFSDTVERNIHNIIQVSIVQVPSGAPNIPYSSAFFCNFVIPAQLNLTAPDAVGGINNIAQVLGNYPNMEVFVPETSQLGQVLALGNVNVGDVPTGGVTVSVTFSALPAGTNYRVSLTIVSQSGSTPQNDVTFTCGVINSTKSTSGFSIRCQEWFGTTQNASIDWVIYKA